MSTAPRLRVILVGLAAGAALVGYLAWASGQPAPVRDPLVRPALADPPVTREIHTRYGTLVEMRVPTDAAGLGVVELQTCYVWRDAQHPSASISCPAPPAVAITEN